MYGGPPAVAMFATNARREFMCFLLRNLISDRYKIEAYRGSEFAPRVLAEHGLPVVMKVLDLQ